MILICPSFHVNWILAVRKNLERGSSTPVSQMLDLQVCATLLPCVFTCIHINSWALFINLTLCLLGAGHGTTELNPAPILYIEAQIVSDLASVSSYVHRTYSLLWARQLILPPQSWTDQEALVPLNKKIVFRSEGLAMPHMTLCLTCSPPLVLPSFHPPSFFLLQISFTKKPLFPLVARQSGCSLVLWRVLAAGFDFSC